MKLSQKKSCEGCKAATFGTCCLGVKLELRTEITGFRQRLIMSPAEPCLKPKTNTELAEAMRSLGIS